MNNSKPKLSLPQPYCQYFFQNNHLTPHDFKPIARHHKTQSHNRKTSQVSTLSCKSKNRNKSHYQNKNHTLNKHPSHYFASIDRKTQKTTGASEKTSFRRKQFSLEKARITLQNKNTLTRKQKLKIDIQHKIKPKTTQNLTSRNLNYEGIQVVHKKPAKSHKKSQSSFSNKYDQIDEKRQSEISKLDGDKFVMPKFKTRQKNLELMISRCSKVMTEYYERINILMKENEYLRCENEQLRRQNEENC